MIGADAHVGAGVEIDSSVVGAGSRIGDRTTINGSIVGEETEIGAGCHVRGLSVVGPGARVGDGTMLDHGVRVAAGETIAPNALSFS